MTIFVEYRVPVLVEVDTESGTVRSVRVVDESIHGPADVFDVGVGSMSEEKRSRAVAIAEDTDWPAWSFGG